MPKKASKPKTKKHDYELEALKNLSKTIELVNKMQDNMIIMDDYDAGRVHAMRMVIEDLKSAVCSENEKELDY